MSKQMNEFFQVMQVRYKASMLNQRETRPRGNGESSSSTVQEKPVRLEFPRYDGLDVFTIWLCRAEHYFEF